MTYEFRCWFGAIRICRILRWIYILCLRVIVLMNSWAWLFPSHIFAAAVAQLQAHVSANARNEPVAFFAFLKEQSSTSPLMFTIKLPGSYLSCIRKFSFCAEPSQPFVMFLLIHSLDVFGLHAVAINDPFCFVWSFVGRERTFHFSHFLFIAQRLFRRPSSFSVTSHSSCLCGVPYGWMIYICIWTSIRCLLTRFRMYAYYIPRLAADMLFRVIAYADWIKYKPDWANLILSFVF